MSAFKYTLFPGMTAISRFFVSEFERYKFTAKEYDEETGLYYYGARYYDAKLSRWCSADPPLARGDYLPVPPVSDEAIEYNYSLSGMGGVFNSINFDAYQYAGQNPIVMIDPDGNSMVRLRKSKTLEEWKEKYPEGTIAGFFVRLLEPSPYDVMLGVGTIESFGTKAYQVGLRTILRGSGRKIFKFGADDLVYGPTANGALRKLQEKYGGKLLTDIANPACKQIIDLSIEMMEKTRAAGNKIHFDLTHIDDIDNVLKGVGKYSEKVTTKELQYLKNNWERFKDTVKFYYNGEEVAAPWK